MAMIEANIIGYEGRIIPTDKGNLIYNIFDLDAPANQGDVVVVNNPNEILNYPIPISIVGSNQNGYTPFQYTSEAGSMSLVRNGNRGDLSWTYLGVPYTSTLNQLSNGDYRVTEYFFRTSNVNVFTTSGNLFRAITYSDTTDMVTVNTENAFGVFSSSRELRSGTIVTALTASSLQLGAFLTDNTIPIPPLDTDPFIPGGENEHGGGGGDFSDPSEDVTDPAVPDISAVDTGFITLFNPSVSQLNSLASYMWSASFDLETFKKMFANPMDCILGLSILPKIVPSGGSRTVMVGNISTGVSMTVAASQYVKFDCGSVSVKRYSNSFLDYAPYTKVSIYLPFIGIHELSVDDVMNKSVHVKYNIDILSGACVAFVICGGTTLYTYTGQCAASVPVTSGDWSNMINGVIGAVGGALKAAVGGAAVGGLVGAVGAGAASLASSAMDVAGMKPSVEHSGNMGGMGGMMGVKTPFLIITRPQQAIPGQQNKYTGYPAFVTKELNALEGYTEIEEIHLENIPATEQELTEIYNLLRNGVIL